jgi:hypothetical protein
VKYLFKVVQGKQRKGRGIRLARGAGRGIRPGACRLTNDLCATLSFKKSKKMTPHYLLFAKGENSKMEKRPFAPFHSSASGVLFLSLKQN